MSISFSGLASGLDTSSWVEQLTALKRAKVTTMQQEKVEASNVKDALANIKSFFTSFRSKLEKVTDSKLFSGTSMDVFTKKLAASSNTDVITATATSSAKEGTYTVEVEKIATATEVKSRYSTTYDKIRTANLDSKLTSLGMDIADEGSQIKVNKNGVESTITLNKSDTIATLLNKLKNVGVEGSFNDKTGTISMNIGKNDIIDTGNTNIKSALHLDNVQSGYETGELTTTKVENVVSAADRDTRLSELGITSFAGKTFGATFSGGYQELSFEDAEDNTKSITLGNLIDFINSNGGTASIDEDGVFEVSGLALSNDFSIDVFDALGLSPTVTETSQTSKALKVTVEDTEGNPITSDTTLDKIFDFAVGPSSYNVCVNEGILDEQITTESTVGDLINILNSNGLSASLSEDGVISVSGGYFMIPFARNFSDVFSINQVGYVGTSNRAFPLTEEVTTQHEITLDTELSDLGITSGIVGCTDADGTDTFFVVNEDETVRELIHRAYGANHNASEMTAYIDRLINDPTTAYDSNEDIYINQETGQIVFKDLTFRNLDSQEVEAINQQVYGNRVEYQEESSAVNILFGANLEDNKIVTSSTMTSEKLYYTEVGSEAATTDTLLSQYYTLGEGEHFSFTLYDNEGQLVEWDDSPEATQLITMADDATIGDLIDTINEKADEAGASVFAQFRVVHGVGKIRLSGRIEANGDFVENTGLTTTNTQEIYYVTNSNTQIQVTRDVTASDNLSTIMPGINPNNDFVSGIQQITDADQITSEGWTAVSTAQGFADALTGGASKILLTGDIDFNGFGNYGRAASDLIINGNGYTISNLTKGLFSNLEDAEVYNLKLTGTMTASYTQFGFLADTAEGTINVHNVTVDGAINTSNNSEYVGLVFGMVWNGADLTLDDIKTSGRVGTTQAEVEDHTEISGGVVGRTTSDCLINITDVITDAAVYGNIAGGIIGEMCYSKANNTGRTVIERCISASTDYEANHYNAIIGTANIEGNANDLTDYNDWLLGVKSGHISNNYYSLHGANDHSLYYDDIFINGQQNYGMLQMAEISGLTSGTGFIIMDDNDEGVAAIDTSACTTIGELLGTLDSYGFEYSITDGVINISNSTNNYYLADTPLTESLGFTTDPIAATTTSERFTKEESRYIYDTDNLLSEIGVTDGFLDVTTHTGTTRLTIDSSDTVLDFKNALDDLGLMTVVTWSQFAVSDGGNNGNGAQLSFSAIDTNILDVLGFSGNNEDVNLTHNIMINSSGDNLYYPTYTPTEVTGNTKLVDITGFGDSEISDFALETGYYHIFTSDGVQHTEEITDTTTVNDLLATLRGYGFDATVSGQGKITVSSTGNAYIAESNYVDNNSNIADLLSLTQHRNTVSDGLGYSTVSNENITRSTKLSDINSDTPYQEGYVTIRKANGNDATIYLESDETVGSFLDKLVANGVDAAVSNGVISVNSQTAYLDDYEGIGTASNINSILNLRGYEVRNYVTDPIHLIDPENTEYDVAADRNTALSDLGVTTGEYNIYNNGVKYTAYISSDETLGSFVDTLKSFGLSVGVFDEGDQTLVKVTGNGNSYLETSANPSASNVVTALFNSPEAKNAYSGTLETEGEETTHPLATSETRIGELAGAWGETVAGNLVVNVNDVESTISIANEDTIGSVLDRLRQLGVEATIADGKITVQGGFNTFSIDTSKSTSSLANPSAATGLIRNEELDDYVSSTEEILSTTLESKDLSVANWADMSTKLGLLNITSGSLSVYKDGMKAVVHVDSSQTFQDLKDAINTEFGGNDIELRFDDGLLKVYSLTDAQVDVGSAIDTSNFASITGIQKDENGVASSSRELYKVNSSSLVTQSGIFRRGDVFAGNFTVGDATITIDDTTTIADLVNKINNSADANANAYWDNVTGNFVITSKSTGASYINTEANTSNFTDIMGYTSSEWETVDEVHNLQSTRMLAENQSLGNNAKFKINGTSYTSTTNTISSDVSRIEGVTINLKGISKEGPVELTIANDKEKVADTVEEVITAYNELMENVDKELASSGNLNNESTLKMIRNQLRTLMTGTEAGMTKFLNLDSIGIGVSKAAAGNISTGNSNVINLSFDRDKFASAFESDPAELKKLLLGEDGNDSAGIFNRVESILDNALKSTNGYFDIAEKTQTNKISNINQKITRQNQYIERYRQQLQNKFKTMDMLISQMNERYRNLLSA